MKVNAILILWRRFRADRRGNIAMIAALSILGLVGSAGLGIDYYNALAAKTRLDLASDAAAIAAINAAQSYIEANSATQTDPALSTAAEAAGEAQALKVFNSNAGSTAKIAATPTITISRTGQTFNATITYHATSQNAFGPIFGVKQINITGTSASSLTMGKYLDFYLLLDVSGSMGLPATTAGQTQLAAISPDNKNVYPGGCVFACHFSQKMCTTIAKPSTAQACQGYILAQSNNIELRAAAVGSAVQSHSHGHRNDHQPIPRWSLSIHFTNGYALCAFEQFDGSANRGRNARQLARYRSVDDGLRQRGYPFRKCHSIAQYTYHNGRYRV
jgi:Flp pilus assembly protein TadG